MEKVDGFNDNAEIYWNGRAHVVSDISDPVLFNIFFDPALPEHAKRMVISINKTNQEGKDLGDVIPCDHLNDATIKEIIRQIQGGNTSGTVLAKDVLPAFVYQTREYLEAVGFDDIGKINGLIHRIESLRIDWQWPVEIHIDGTEASLEELKPAAIDKIASDMLCNECVEGMW